MDGWKKLAGAALLALGLGAPAWAALPAPTPEQQAAAAKKKADAAAQAERDKQTLAESMERVSGYWRQRAQAQGWPVQPQTAVQPVAGINASTNQSSSSGQPGGKLGEAAKEAPIRSEKLGTAPPSEDVKKPAPPQAVR